MKQLMFYLKRLPKRAFMATALLTAMLVLPFHSMAADSAVIEGSMGVANQTTGETTYKPSTNATYDQVVKFQVFYHNRELADSGRVAENFKIKVNMPTQASTSQVVSMEMGGTNTNQITDTATVNLNRADAMIEFIPGTTYWKHNIGTRENPNIVTQQISDSKILNGEVLETTLQPCHEFEATVTFMARVKVPSVGVYKKVRKAGTQDATTTAITAQPGDRLEYVVTAKNLSNTNLSNVYLRDPLPAGLTFVPGTAKKYYGTYGGTVMTADEANAFFNGRKNIGTLTPGAQGSIVFEATVANLAQLACGQTVLKNIAVVDTDQTGEYNASVIATVNKTCQSVPTYSCDALNVTIGANREVTVSEFRTSQANGATFKDALVNWGDGAAVLTTNTVVGQKHTYAKDGEFNIGVTARFNVNGEVVTANGANCVKKVTFTTTPPTVTTPGKPTVLPSTGPGEVIGLFTAATTLGAVAHRARANRRS